MDTHRRKSLARLLLGTAAVPVATYGALAAHTYWRYGSPRRPRPDEEDPLLDELMPEYDVVERHAIDVNAPADVTLRAATQIELFASPLVRCVFRTRELVLGADSDAALSKGLIELAKSLGWGTLCESPGHEIIMGAVTQPWKANVVFHSVPAPQFQQFAAPGFVKIAWTLRADPIAEHRSVFRTETRAAATDPVARAKFRQYWAFVFPGVWLIRRLTLAPIKQSAERQVNALSRAVAVKCSAR